MAVLSNMLFERDMLSEKERSEIQQLVGERHSLNQRASEIIERFQACTHAKVAAEHELAKQAVRDQMALIDKHRGEIGALTRDLNRVNEKRTHAFAQRDSAQEEQRRLSRYATKAEQDKANLLLSKRESDAGLAAQEHGQIQARINHLTLVELQPLIERLERSSQRRRRS